MERTLERTLELSRGFSRGFGRSAPRVVHPAMAAAVPHGRSDIIGRAGWEPASR
jgi:hypothetical protein